MNFTELKISHHAFQRMLERKVRASEIAIILSDGEIVASYLDDKPYPSYLMSGKVGKRSLHIVVALVEETGLAIVITVYEPDDEIWEPGHRVRRQ